MRGGAGENQSGLTWVGGLGNIRDIKNLPCHLEGILDIKTELDFSNVC